MSAILPAILLSVSRQFTLDSPGPIDPKAKERLLQSIKILIDPHVFSGKAQKYTQAIRGVDKVQKAAHLFFNELANLPDSLQQKDLNGLFSIRKASIGSAGLSPLALSFYQAVLSTIQANCKTQNPQKMPLILCHILSEGF